MTATGPAEPGPKGLGMGEGPEPAEDPELTEDGPDDSKAVGRRYIVLVGATFLVLVLASVLALVPLPYVIMSPGPITDTLGSIDGKKIIDVGSTPTHPTSGRLYFTTVRIAGGPGARVTIYDLVGAKLDSHAQVLDEQAVFPSGVTQSEVEEQNTAEMTGSQDTAAAVALRALGKDVRTEVYVDQVSPGGPSDGTLMAGDVIVSIDGQPATDGAVVRAAVLAKPVGSALSVRYRRNGSERTATITSRDSGGHPIIGILMGVRHDLPIPVRIHAGAVGGPSAGMMFALGIYDVLSDGDLTGGKAIAGTGTIDDSGAVGPIGGIREKLYGAQAGGVQWFLAPEANCAEVVGQVPQGMHVVKVGSFEQAKEAVESIAHGSGASLPSCS